MFSIQFLKKKAETKEQDLESMLTCPVCLDKYNQTKRRPMVLVPCGHTICNSCYGKLTVNNCPIDRGNIQSTVVNHCLTTTNVGNQLKPICMKKNEQKMYIDSLL